MILILILIAIAIVIVVVNVKSVKCEKLTLHRESSREKKGKDWKTVSSSFFPSFPADPFIFIRICISFSLPRFRYFVLLLFTCENFPT